MSHSLSPVSLKDVPLIVEADPIELPWLWRFIMVILMVVGVLAFVQEIYTGNEQHAWVSLQVNFTYWFCVAAASSCFAAVFHICNAQWSRPIRRIFEASIPFLLLSPVFLIILYLGHHHLFSWSHHPVPGKGIWLTSNFLYLRDVLGVILLAVLAKRLIYLSVRRDIAAIRGGLTGLSAEKLERWNHKKYDRYVAGADEDAVEEIEKTSLKMSRYSPVVVMAFAFIMTLIAFDQIMSVDPHWYSTMFGGFYFMSGVYLAMAFASIAVACLRRLSPVIKAKIERRTLHDLGKLLFGFGIFWAYLFWCHYLPIWYANLPEETGWMILRLREQPWHRVAWMVLGTSFIIPFMLGLSRDLKQVPVLLLGTALIPCIGLWLQQYLLFAPTLYPDTLPMNLTDLAITLGFLGAYVLCSASYLARVPLIPFGDLYWDPYKKAACGEAAGGG